MEPAHPFHAGSDHQYFKATQAVEADVAEPAIDKEQARIPRGFSPTDAATRAQLYDELVRVIDSNPA